MIYTLNWTNGIHLADPHGSIFALQNSRINYKEGNMPLLEDRIVQSIQ